MDNPEVSADQDLNNLFKQGDSTNTDAGNGDAGDFLSDPMTNDQQQKAPVQNEPPKNQPDTSKSKGKPEDKTPVKTIQSSPVIKPLDDKDKKLIKKEKGKTGNEY